jgi:FAD/FMN-containing dehydrogenase
MGGTVAENAGGAHCFKYGVTSHYVLGLEAILADGTTRRFGGPAGGFLGDLCNWRDLMVGSEGVLAAFTKFWLRLVPKPGKVWTLRCAFTSLKPAIECILDLVRHPSIPAAVEFMDSRSVNMIEDSPARVGLRRDSCVILIEVDGPEVFADVFAREIEAIMRHHDALDILSTDSSEQSAKLWKARKGAGGLLGQISPDLMVQDAVLPRTRLIEFLEAVYRDADAEEIPVVCFFHAGDGNVHPNYLFDARDSEQLEKVERLGKKAMQRVVDLGGVLSGEHGIGMDKMKYMKMLYSPAELALQRGVAITFNPDHRLNPGKVIEGRNFQATKARNGV